jgi:RNA polymerase sigma-70 factor, ECF subfamily
MMTIVSTGRSPEEDLIQEAARGDRSAFGELYLRYARMVHGVLLTRVPPGQAEDLVQDVFVSALRQLGSLRAAGAFPAWLAAMARNRAADYFREERRRAILDAGAPALSDRRDGTEALVVLDLIRALPEAYRETLVLRLVEGLTGPEIARQTGLTPESVRVNLCRGMKLLRQMIRKEP